METKYRCKRCHNIIAIKTPNCPECTSSDGYISINAAATYEDNKPRHIAKQRKTHIVIGDTFEETLCGKTHFHHAHNAEYAAQQERNFGLISMGGWCKRCTEIFLNIKK